MNIVKDLRDVEAKVLPARVMVLLSKYSQAIKEDESVVIQLSSLNVFKHVHSTFLNTTSSRVKRYYKILLKEVNLQILSGDMTFKSNSEASYHPYIEADVELDERYRSDSFWSQNESKDDFTFSVLNSN